MKRGGLLLKMLLIFGIWMLVLSVASSLTIYNSARSRWLDDIRGIKSETYLKVASGGLTTVLRSADEISKILSEDPVLPRFLESGMRDTMLRTLVIQRLNSIKNLGCPMVSFISNSTLEYMDENLKVDHVIEKDNPAGNHQFYLQLRRIDSALPILYQHYHWFVEQSAWHGLFLHRTHGYGKRAGTR